MSEETNANINLLYIVLVPCSLFMSFSFQFFYRVLFYGRYFSLYSPLELSSFYTCSSSKPLLEQLSNQLSSSAFLNDNLPGNTVQKSTPHKCGHNGRYSAFNMEVADFLQIVWSLPFSQCIFKMFLRGGNFMERPYNGPSK